MVTERDWLPRETGYRTQAEAAEWQDLRAQRRTRSFLPFSNCLSDLRDSVPALYRQQTAQGKSPRKVNRESGIAIQC
jgi:hypothetical protein